MAVPEKILTNADLEKFVDTSDEWIASRTGIRQRHVCSEGESTSTLSIAAAKQAIADAGITPDDIDLVICATATGDHPWPATACIIQREIGANRAAAYDLSAACSGFVYALATAAGMIQSGTMRRILIIGADTLSKQVDWKDRGTCILFGDGAGAVVVGPCPESEGVLASALGSDGTGMEQIWLEAGAAGTPITPQMVEEGRSFIRMKGAEVFKFAVRIMGDICIEALCRAGITPKEVDLFIPHQANLRIIDAAADRMQLPPEKVFKNVDKYGNTSAASVPIALCEAVQAGRVHKGDVLVFVGFGAGLTWGANVVRWSRND
jgi:3-oxoacyl-[acyl-carrier-protein] synthase-3